MAVYKYTGRTTKGKLKRGTLESETRNEAIVELKKKGISPREISETKATIFNRDLSKGAKSTKNRDFVIYCRQFATLIRSGISIIESTHILASQTESKVLRTVLPQIEEDIRAGRSFSEAAQRHKKVFPPLFVNMIRAGELTGNIDDTLERLANYFEKQYTLQKKVQSTMIYPVVLLVLIIVVVVFMMLYIIPSFIGMFDQFGSDLPLITKVVVQISNILQKFWWLMLLITVGVIGGFSFAFKQSKDFKYAVHLILLRLPVFGKVLQKAAIARMTRTLSSLFSSSVPILQSLTVVEKVVGNPVIGKIVLEARDNLEEGGTLSAPLEKSWVFPALVWQMTAIGEKTGSLDYMLEKIADFYEEDVDRTVDSLKSIIEPVMIIILAVFVGAIVLSIMIPMFSIFTDIN